MALTATWNIRQDYTCIYVAELLFLRDLVDEYGASTDVRCHRSSSYTFVPFIRDR
jgi:hypothetical protein